jgi:transposase
MHRILERPLYFYNRTTSGVAEKFNNKIKLIKRQAYGFTNFEHLRMSWLTDQR